MVPFEEELRLTPEGVHHHVSENAKKLYMKPFKSGVLMYK